MTAGANPGAASGRPVEVELKLAASQGVLESDVAEVVRSLGLEASQVATRAHVDHYLDTERFDLARHGVGLRLRESEGHTRLAVKLRGAGPADTGVWRRVELEEEIAPGAPLPPDAAALPPALRARVQPFTLTRPLGEIAQLVTERSVRRLVAPASDAIAELCVDRVRVGSGTDAPRFSEVELEDVSLGEATLRSVSAALQERLTLVPSRADKLARALALTGRAVRGDAAPVLAPDSPLRVAACAVLARGLEALRAAEADARDGVDPDGVHRMRVATRRMRAALRLFAGAFPAGRSDAPMRTLRRTGDSLGPVRELDVLRIALPELTREMPSALAADLEPFAAMLDGFHARERTRLLRALESPARLRAQQRFESFVARGLASHPRGDGARPLGEVAPALLAAAAARVWKRGDRVGRRSAPADLHRLRIGVKRLRYAAEMLSPLYGDDLADWLHRTSELQEVLGAVNDAGVASARIASWIDTREGRRLPRRTLVAAGALLGLCEQRAHEARGRFRKTWKKFARPKARRQLEQIAQSISRGAPEPDATPLRA